MTPNLIITHCSAAPPRFGFDDINAWHKERGWGVKLADGRFVSCGYHLVISKPDDVTGWIAEIGRPENVQGSHARGANRRSLGIVICGDYDAYPPDPEALQLAAQAVAVWCLTYSIGIERVLGHREITQVGAPDPRKTCPGSLFDMEAFRLLVDDKLDVLTAIEGTG